MVRFLILCWGLDVIIWDVFLKSNEFKEGMCGVFGSVMNDKVIVFCWSIGIFKVVEMIVKYFDLFFWGGLKVILKEFFFDI